MSTSQPMKNVTNNSYLQSYIKSTEKIEVLHKKTFYLNYFYSHKHHLQLIIFMTIISCPIKKFGKPNMYLRQSY